MAAQKQWEEGQSGNPNGRPAGKGSKPISPLRRTLNQLRKLEPRALENIKAVINGTKIGQGEDGEIIDTEDGAGSVDKMMLETSKWVISQISALSRSATQEESLRHAIRKDAEEKVESPEAPPSDGSGKVIPINRKMSTDLLPDVDEEENEDDEE